MACIAAGIAYAIFLYFRTKKFEGKNKNLKILLGLLRFLSVAVIGLLLLGPLFKTTEEEAKKPTIAIVQDASQSIEDWVAQNQPAYNGSIQQLVNSLGEKYDVDFYTFGSDIVKSTSDSIAYDQELTNIDHAIQYVSDIYEGDNLGAVILATDGIYNDGKSPLYSQFNHVAPIYSIALGDTTRQNDLILKSVLHNEIGYLNDQIVIQADIQAYDSANAKTRLSVQKKNNNTWTNVYTKDISIRGNSFFSTEDITLDLSQVGVVQYRLSLSTLNGETNRQNNSRDIFIEVLDARQNIWVIANAPNPDLGTIKQLLERNKNYEVTISYELPTTTQLREIDLAILHNLPSTNQSISGLMDQLNRNATPRMFILGSQINLSEFNKVQEAISIKGQNGVVNESQASIAEDFNNFTLSPELIRRVKQYPPLASPFGEYTFDLPSTTLLSQRIGSISTDFPLLSYNDQNGVKTAFLFGEGIWRWKYFDFVEDGQFDIIGELMDKTITYISTVEDKRKFRVSTTENVYLENDDILFSGELYNNSYELVNEPEVVMTITNEDRQEFNYTFSAEGKTYRLNAGKMSPGNYRYQAKTLFNGEAFEVSGRFAVREIQYELFDFEANHSVLYSLSQKNNGKVYYPNAIDQIRTDLLTNENLKPVIYQNQTTKSVLDFKWLFGLLCLLLGAEWFLRRYFGSI